MKKANYLMAAALIAASAPSFAAGGYVGLMGGQGRAQDAATNVNQGAAELAAAGISSSGSYDEGRGAWGVYGGYSFTPFISGEVGYVNFGTYHLNATFTGAVNTTATEDDKVSAFYAAAVGSYPIAKQVSIFGKLGVAQSKNDETCAIAGGTCTAASDSKTGPVLGLGASVDVAHNVAVGLEYDLFKSIGDKNNEYTGGDFSFVHVNATYRF